MSYNTGVTNFYKQSGFLAHPVYMISQYLQYRLLFFDSFQRCGIWTSSSNREAN